MNDINLINAINSMLDYAIKKDKEMFDIPDAHQQIVMERFDKVRKNPERLLDWDEASNIRKSG